MPNLLQALSSFFEQPIGAYWGYMYIGIGVAMCFIIIFDNLRK